MRRFLLFIVAALSLTTANAQTVKEVTDSVKAASKSRNFKAMVSTVKGAFAAKSAKAEELVDTWVYVEPAVLSTSHNMLSKMAGNGIANKLEKLIYDFFERAKVNSENTSFTFHENGTYSRSLAGKSATGTWMTAGDQLLLAVRNVQTAAMTSHMENDTLTLVADMSKTMKDIQELGGFSDSRTNKALVKLSKHIKGLKVGFLLAREKQ